MSRRVSWLGGVSAVLLVCALVLTMLPAAYAQETTGGIKGYVKDKSGASVPISGARVSRSARNCINAVRRSGSIPAVNSIIRLKSLSDKCFLSRAMKVSMLMSPYLEGQVRPPRTSRKTGLEASECR